MADDDLLRRLLDAGMTFSAMTQARAEALIRDLVKQGEVQAEQAQATIDELLDRSRRNSERWIEAVKTEIDQQIANLNLATRDDIERAVMRFADAAATAFRQVMPDRFTERPTSGTATSASEQATATATGAAKQATARATTAAKKATGGAKKAGGSGKAFGAAKPARSAKTAGGPAKATAKKATGAAKKSGGTAKKAGGSAKKAARTTTGTAKKAGGTAKKAGGTTKKAGGTTKKAGGSAQKSAAKKAPARKAGGSSAS
jgi:polyhydroxyalkanoate synthesis regulator phasin